MATLEQLETGGHLHRYDADLETWEMPERHMFHAPDFGLWFENVLKPAPCKRGRNVSPYEQVEQIFYDFVVGHPMAYSVDYRKLDPITQHIWEFKTQDVRVFGWLCRRRHFVAVCGDFKDNLVRAKQYKPYIEQVSAFRQALDLDEPKAIHGVKYHDIF